MQRKLFRIEEMNRAQRTPPLNTPGAAAREIDADRSAFARELAALRDTIADNAHDLARLLNEGKERRMGRAASELGAAVDAMERSTDKILKSAEVIDDNAKTLNMSLKSDYNCGLAQDISEQLTLIYEACNFQDLAGQRIGKVIGTLNQLEEAMTRMLARCEGRLGGEAGPVMRAPRRDLLNGPQLDGDSGHASQCEIDALFG